MDTLAIVLRFGSYAVLSLIAGVPLFLWLALGRDRGRLVFRQIRAAYALLLILGAALALFGLLAATAAMTGTALFPVEWDMVALVLSATASGKAIVARATLLIVLLPLAMRASLRPAALIAALATATLAWSGHAAAGEGMAGGLHLLADMLHILAAALWIGGMACLLLSLHRAQGGATLPMLHAFALIGSVTVGLLIATGILNGVMIIGLDALPAALGTIYGRLLAIKVGAFLVMLLLAANNRFRLTPAFERHAITARPALRRAIGVEIALAFLILLLVGWLGMIDPMAAA
ncbi:MAG TPA: copper homeostasis membrane protein CopD [Sphingobium sp.]|uniref:copper homeostasis membrane protein CopD n=1 Tax=Sphingobium sp. TaxID=1912891 RepID=UPI002ED1ADCC